MNDDADQSSKRGASDADGSAGLEHSPAKRSKGPPKEGSNRGYETDENKRANIGGSISGRPPKSGSDHADDGRHDKKEDEADAKRAQHD